MTTQKPPSVPGSSTLCDVRIDGVPYRVEVAWTVRTTRFRRRTLLQIVTVFGQRVLQRHPEVQPFRVLPEVLTAEEALAIDEGA